MAILCVCECVCVMFLFLLCCHLKICWLLKCDNKSGSKATRNPNHTRSEKKNLHFAWPDTVHAWLIEWKKKMAKKCTNIRHFSCEKPIRWEKKVCSEYCKPDEQFFRMIFFLLCGFLIFFICYNVFVSPAIQLHEQHKFHGSICL